MTNNKNISNKCMLYSKNKTDWFTDIHETLIEPGDTVWMKYRRHMFPHSQYLQGL